MSTVSTLHEDAEALLETIDSAESKKKYARLTPNDRVTIYKLAAKGNITQAKIAEAVGCDPTTVSRALRFVDTRHEARMILESGAAKMADTVVNTKDAKIALNTLGKLDVVREEAQQGGNNVLITFGQPLPEAQQPPTTRDDQAALTGLRRSNGSPITRGELAAAGTVVLIGTAPPGTPQNPITVEARGPVVNDAA